MNDDEFMQKYDIKQNNKISFSEFKNVFRDILLAK